MRAAKGHPVVGRRKVDTLRARRRPHLAHQSAVGEQFVAVGNRRLMTKARRDESAGRAGIDTRGQAMSNVKKVPKNSRNDRGPGGGDLDLASLRVGLITRREQRAPPSIEHL